MRSGHEVAFGITEEFQVPLKVKHEVISRILTDGLIAIRSAAREGDLETALRLSDALHNLPLSIPEPCSLRRWTEHDLLWAIDDADGALWRLLVGWKYLTSSVETDPPL